MRKIKIEKYSPTKNIRKTKGRVNQSPYRLFKKNGRTVGVTFYSPADHDLQAGNFEGRIFLSIKQLRELKWLLEKGKVEMGKRFKGLNLYELIEIDQWKEGDLKLQAVYMDGEFKGYSYGVWDYEDII